MYAGGGREACLRVNVYYLVSAAAFCFMMLAQLTPYRVDSSTAVVPATSEVKVAPDGTR
jgi:hypothetical protein